ncbi:MAG: RICIN domain-containing protein [Eubacteriales bacterium]|nr:RICIN domain-containing protein [Eubacteriales bacterium]
MLGEVQNLGDEFTAYILNPNSSKPLTVEKNDNVIISSKTSRAEQIWKFFRKKDGSYRIINCETGKALDAGGTDGNIYTYESCDNAWQSWYVFGTSDSYCLKSQATNEIIYIVGGNTEDGVNAQLYLPNGTPAQKFKIEKVDFYGDLNADGLINIKDLILFIKWFQNDETLIENYRAADIDENNIVNIVDFIMLKNLLI